MDLQLIALMQSENLRMQTVAQHLDLNLRNEKGAFSEQCRLHASAADCFEGVVEICGQWYSIWICVETLESCLQVLHRNGWTILNGMF
jgi:hypothetical protein